MITVHDKITQFCSDVWNENKHNFVTIDLTRAVNCGKYRKNLTEFWSPICDDEVMQSSEKIVL